MANSEGECENSLFIYDVGIWQAVLAHIKLNVVECAYYVHNRSETTSMYIQTVMYAST